MMSCLLNVSSTPTRYTSIIRSFKQYELSLYAKLLSELFCIMLSTVIKCYQYIKNPYFGRYFSRSRFQMTAYGPLYTEYQSVDSKTMQFTLSVYVIKYSAQYSGTNGYFRHIHVCIILSHDTLGALWVQHN